jgi:hypothetical protein
VKRISPEVVSRRKPAETGRKGGPKKPALARKHESESDANYAVKAETGGNRQKQTIRLLLNALGGANQH